MGQVVDTSGAPAAGVRVCAYPIERGPAFGASCTRSGNEGSFVLDTRAGGRHQVMADDPDGGHLSQRRLFYRAPGLPVVDVVLGDGAGAASYTVEVDFCNGRSPTRECTDPYPLHRDPPMAGITATSYTFTFIGAQPGRWRVFAVDSLGRPGFKSPWRVFVHER